MAATLLSDGDNTRSLLYGTFPRSAVPGQRVPVGYPHPAIPADVRTEWPIHLPRVFLHPT